MAAGFDRIAIGRRRSAAPILAVFLGRCFYENWQGGTLSDRPVHTEACALQQRQTQHDIRRQNDETGGIIDQYRLRQDGLLGARLRV